MNKGLDLQGGVHFLMQIDMKGALTKRMDSSAADIRALLRDKDIRHAGITEKPIPSSSASKTKQHAH